jgi:hypothetical protein
MGTKAKSLSEAGRLGKCLALCESLDILDFDFTCLARVVDLRPALTSSECLIMKLKDPNYFLVVSRNEALLSPLLELDQQIIWAYAPAADTYGKVPVIVPRSEVGLIPTRAEQDVLIQNTRAY